MNQLHSLLKHSGWVQGKTINKPTTTAKKKKKKKLNSGYISASVPLNYILWGENEPPATVSGPPLRTATPAMQLTCKAGHFLQRLHNFT